MITGKISGVCVSSTRGTSKKNIEKGYLLKDYGLVGDAHAGSERQVSLLMAEQIEEMAKKQHIDIRPGDFAENITVQGIDLTNVKTGTHLQLGESEIEVIEIGKHGAENHTFSFHGMALLVDKGIFCRVIKSGRVKVGDEVRIINSPENHERS